MIIVLCLVLMTMDEQMVKNINKWIDAPIISPSNPNTELIEEKINKAKTIKEFPEKIVSVGESFIGTPYNTHILNDDSLTTRIDSLDCWTFVENTVAITLSSTTENGNYNLYKQILIRLRYRNGINNGYISRIHYFLEWKTNLEKRDVASNYSEYLNGTQMHKNLSYISAHAPDSLKQVLKKIETNICADGFYYVDKGQIDDSRLMDGDIVGFVSIKPDLDVEHLGIVKKINGIAYFIHASNKCGVCVSNLPLKEYLNQNSTKIGIIVVRVYKSDLQ